MDVRRALALLLLALPVVPSGAFAATADRQADVEHRGAAVMPFDQDRTMHVFTPTADGGVQAVTVHDGDPQQIALVRAHLRKEATAFAHGDFRDPAAIHGDAMPGLAALRAGASSIAVRYADVANGGRITYTTSDPALVTALHAWFDAQVSDHGAHAMKGH